MSIEEEFTKIDQSGSWLPIYHKIRQDCLQQHDFSVKDAKKPEFKGRNRYRDVSPYDHNRIKLQRDDIDYINASLLSYPAANRSYILTQGPLPNTAGHFWLMIWEHDSKAVLMLNRVIEKGQIKCHQYFPTGAADDKEMHFDDVGLKVTFISEQDANFFSVRTLDLEDTATAERKRVLQFHYTTWPDFGVPDSPRAFLEFLFAVREAGVLEAGVGPPVIHCSAGIGRSGTFCLVDTCLILIEKALGRADLEVCDVLMEMRRSRMGLIQTADQLRFSYIAIIEGCHSYLASTAAGDDTAEPQTQVQHTEEKQDLIPEVCDVTDEDEEIQSLPDGPSNNNNSLEECSADAEDMAILKDRTLDQEIKRRKRDERKKKTSEQIAKMKRKQRECEKWQIRQHSLQPYLWGVSVAVLIGSCILYQCYS